MEVNQWRDLADKYQDSCARLSRSLIVGHVMSLVFLLVGFGIPDFPIDQIFTLQFVLVCMSLAATGMAASVNYMFTMFAIKQIGGTNGRKG